MLAEEGSTGVRVSEQAMPSSPAEASVRPKPTAGRVMILRKSHMWASLEGRNVCETIAPAGGLLNDDEVKLR